MKSRGSTLLLGMVIVSIVLASGVGVSTLLLRQMRGVEDKETAAIAFYVADTIAEGMEKGVIEKPVEDWEQINWEDVKREIWYKGEKEGGTYLIKINIGDNYYNFERDVDEEKEEGEFLSTYYENPEGSMDVEIAYEFYDADNNRVGSWNYGEMNDSEYGEWVVYDIKEDTEEIARIRFAFSDDGGESWGEIYNVYKNYEIEEYFYPYEGVFFDYRVDNGLSTYYENPEGSMDVEIAYEFYDADNNRVGSWNYGEMNDSEYGEWVVYDIKEDTEEIARIRFAFSDDGGESWGEIYNVYKNYEIEEYFYPYEGVFFPFD